VARRRPAEDLSTEELRHLLVEKRRAERNRRLDHFRRSGRVVLVEPQPVKSAFESIGTSDEEEPAIKPSRRRKWLDRILLVLEVVAVIGLGFVLFNGVSLLRNLNKEVASVIEQPTLTPTPLISSVILPSGHTPPDSAGGAQFNWDEIPEHLRPLVQSQAELPVPTASPEQALRIQIPNIDVDAPVVQGDGVEQLKKGVGQHIGTPNPGQAGNIVLSAHNDIFGEIFRDLDKLQKGDEIIIYTSTRPYIFIVQQTQIVDPTQVDVMGSTQESIVTLISCYPYMVDKQRIVVTAKMVN
jgi:sortase A